MKQQLQSIACALFIALLTSIGFAESTDPIVGVWELNVAKSTFAPGRAPKQQTRKIVQEGELIKTAVTGERFDGRRVDGWTWTQNIHYDGKEYPMLGVPQYDTVSVKRVDQFKSEFTQKKDGQVVLTGTMVMSKDGRTMTITTNGRSPGDPPTAVWVFEKKQ